MPLMTFRLPADCYWKPTTAFQSFTMLTKLRQRKQDSYVKAVWSACVWTWT